MKTKIKGIWIVVILFCGIAAILMFMHVAEKEKEVIHQGQLTLNEVNASLREKIVEWKNRARKYEAANQFVQDNQGIHDNDKAEDYGRLQEIIGTGLIPIDTPLLFKPGLTGTGLLYDTVHYGKDVIGTYKTFLDELMSDIVREDLFDLVGIYNEDVGFLYQSDPDRLSGLRRDTILQKFQPNDLGVNIRDVSISSVPHKAFIKPVKLYEEEYFLIGFVDREKYDTAIRMVDFRIVNVAFILLMIIFSLVPVIRIIFYGRGDNMNKSNVLECGLSVLLVAAVLALGISYTFNGMHMNQQHRDMIRNQAGKLNAHQGIIQKFLHIYKNTLTNYTENNSYPIDHELKFNELLTTKKQGADSLAQFEEIAFHPYKETQTIRHVPKDVVSIYSRDYYKMHYSDRKGSGKNFFSAHYSYTGGRFEGVISTQSDAQVYAVTFPFDSLNDKTNHLISQGIKFLIISGNGQVLYHNQETKRIRNLYEEMDKSEYLLVELSKNPLSPRHINFNLRGRKYSGFLERLQTEDLDLMQNDLFVLTYADSSQPRIQEAAAIGDTLFITSINFLLIVLLSFALSVGKKRDNRLGYNDLSYDWLRPKVKNIDHFRHLTIVCVTLSVASVVFYCFLFRDLFFITLLNLSTISFLAFYKFFRLSEWRKNVLFFSVSVFFTIVFLFTTLLYYFTVYQGIYKALPFIVVLLGIGLYFILGKILPESKVRDFTTAHARFKTLMFTWVFTITFLPSFLNYATSLNLEKVVWQEADLTHQPNDVNPVPEFFYATFNSLRIMPTYFEMDDIRIKNNSYKAVTRELLAEALYRMDQPFYERAIPGTLLLFTYLFVAGIMSVVLYNLIGWLINRIYLWEVVKYYNEEKKGQSIGENLLNFSDEESPLYKKGLPFRCLVVCMPGSDKAEKLREDFCAKFKCKTFDLAGRETLEEFGKLKNKDLENFVLTNLDALLYDLESFGTFLSGMERLALDEDKLKRILVFSYSTVDGLIEKLRENIDFEKYREEKGIKDKVESFIGRLEKLSGAFSTVVMDIGAREEAEIDSETKRELFYGNRTFLSALESKGSDNEKDEQAHYEHLVLQVQGINKGYYYSLWNALSLRDKHTIHDLSESGFANYKNIGRINHLVSMGIFRVITDECRVVLFNNSFRNFVLRAIHKSEFQVFDHLNKHEGNWHSVRILLGVILLILLSFISYVDANVINKFMGILGSGVASIGLLGRALASVGALSLPNLLGKSK